MRLVNYGPGEIIDRLTILQLKILHGREAKKVIDHFEKERAALLTQLRSRAESAVWFEHTLELAVVNGQIWNGEDLLRSYRETKGAPTYESAACRIAFHLQEWNDRRHELIRLINVGAGEHQGAEKV